MERIAILGGGVAGLSAARRLVLAGCAPVVIAPVRTVPSRGETLSREACRSLEALGWADMLRSDIALPSEGRFSVWGDGVLRRADEAGTGFHLDRPQLEARMEAALATSGMERITTTAAALEHLPRGVRVTLSGGGDIEAAAVIDCTGRAALSSGASADRRRLDRLVAASQVFDLPDDAEVAAVTLVEAVDAGWWFVAPLPGRRMVLTLFTDSDLLPVGAAREGGAWTGRLGETRAVAARLDSLGLEADASCLPEIATAASIPAARLIEGRILRAGDAAAAMDPLAANGLATAIWSGLRAAEACLALLSGDGSASGTYAQVFLEGIARQVAMQQAIYASERRFADAPFWSRRRYQPMP